MIAFTSPSPEFGAMCLDVAREIGIPATLVDGTFAVALDGIRALMAKTEIAAVVSVRATADLLRHSLAVPVIEAEVTDGDVLRALVEAHRAGGSVAVFWNAAAEYVPDFAALGKLLGVSAFMLRYQSEADIQEAFRQAREMGAAAVVMGSAARIPQARELGLHPVVLQAGRPAVVAAVLRCRYLLQMRSRDQQSAAWLRAMVQAVGEGMVAFDSAGQLLFMNAAAERILELTESEARTGISGPAPPEKLARIAMMVRSGQERTDTLSTLGRNQVLASTHPACLDDQRIGTLVCFQEVSRVQQMESRIRRALQDRGHTARYCFDDMIGTSAALQATLATARRFATVDYTVLLQGETGTGKEVLAQGIHQASRRASGPFVAVNCGALPETLLESELFGYEEGAFTGARRGGKPGLFEIAHGGTLFLDEIDKLPLRLQAGLLRALQERQLIRLGGERVIPVDVRIVSATNRELWPAVEAGEFRMDLFFRLHVLRVRIPSLRERPEDIVPLAEFFLRRYEYQGLRGELSAGVQARMLRYEWPGNVRELENVVLRLLLLGESEFWLPGEPLPPSGALSAPLAPLAQRSLPPQMHPGSSGLTAQRDFPAPDRPVIHPGPQDPRPGEDSVLVPLGSLREMQQILAQAMVERCGGSAEAAARGLGISRVTLWRWLGPQRAVAGRRRKPAALARD